MDLQAYFVQVAKIWRAYNEGKISVAARDALLAPFRREIAAYYRS